MNLNELTKLLSRKNGLLRAISALAAILVLLWSVIWPPLELWLKSDPILTVHQVELTNAAPGEIVQYSLTMTKSRADCDVVDNYAYHDSMGIYHRLLDEDLVMPAGKFQVIRLNLRLPRDTATGPAGLMVSVRYTHPTDRSCDQFFTLGPYPFIILEGSDGRE